LSDFPGFFPDGFWGDLSGMAFSNRWWSVGQDVTGVPAWKSLPSWYMVAANDQAIPPDADAERHFAKRIGATTVEVPSSHVPMVYHPEDVIGLTEKAVETCAASGELAKV
jgi:pimeloyl-ACP methyl ester carboxylesterase